LSNYGIRNILNIGVLTFKHASNKPGRRRTRPGGSNYRRTSNSILIFISFFGGLSTTASPPPATAISSLKAQQKPCNKRSNKVNNRCKL